ncbi:hypothetical protein [Bosea sp. 685]|uniref:hypothetical protein n=1 Tax=Bosea sp. 685 TaxID=3080057 RepID=UPI002893746C|nr:hypothetical protein [Bosea sp. 685]WNJ94126.1 hypothetical protein RMR04_05500 [Bosea sp. 685]
MNSPRYTTRMRELPVIRSAVYGQVVCSRFIHHKEGGIDDGCFGHYGRPPI